MDPNAHNIGLDRSSRSYIYDKKSFRNPQMEADIPQEEIPPLEEEIQEEEDPEEDNDTEDKDERGEH
jgi:hypothetical protein